MSLGVKELLGSIKNIGRKFPGKVGRVLSLKSNSFESVGEPGVEGNEPLAWLVNKTWLA